MEWKDVSGSRESKYKSPSCMEVCEVLRNLQVPQDGRNGESWVGGGTGRICHNGSSVGFGLREPAETVLLHRPTGQGSGEWVHPLWVTGGSSSHQYVSN